MIDNKSRCTWPTNDALMIDYHDNEWGVPVHDDRKFFEFLVLDTFQAGLSWRIVLHKRKAFAKAFANFDPKKVTKFDQRVIGSLQNDVGIIRNKLKIAATVTNASAFLNIQKEFGSFADYIWRFTDQRVKINRWRKDSDIPASTRESDAMSLDLKKRGFKFVGSTICYAFMQAAGLVNDHLISCYRYEQLKKNWSR
ncbi:MAG: DNA-3-methyladenine glycosylase I [Candidatus Komeilibacteria bacterium]|nr:DNA-3-methyladenine glycosylase I [Candidatus Komeilibacteria bacterium]